MVCMHSWAQAGCEAAVLPSFLAGVQPQAQQAGRQLRMLARLPVSRRLAEQLVESSATEAAAAASLASGDPWAGVDTALCRNTGHDGDVSLSARGRCHIVEPSRNGERQGNRVRG